MSGEKKKQSFSESVFYEMPLGDAEDVNPPLPATPTSTHRQPGDNTQGDLNEKDTSEDVKPPSDDSQQQTSFTHDQSLSSAEGVTHRDEQPGKDASGDREHCRLRAQPQIIEMVGLTRQNAEQQELQMKEQQAKKPVQKMETEPRSKME